MTVVDIWLISAYHSWSRRTGDYTGEMVPLPLSRLMFERLAPYARISQKYIHVLAYKTSACMFTTPTLPVNIGTMSTTRLRDEYLSKFASASLPLSY